MLSGMTDWHSHILFGVDDGVPDVGESLEILDADASFGIRRVWLTPHIMEDMPNATDDLRQRFNQLREAYSGPVELRLAAENMLDPLFEKRLEEGDLLPIGDRGDHLLVETSYVNAPLRFRELLREIKSKGYFPVLAHPERYRYMTEDDYRSLRAEEIRFQTNLFSLVGIYGQDAARRASWLLRQGMIDICGSDIHKASMLRFFEEKIRADKDLGSLASLSTPRTHP